MNFDRFLSTALGLLFNQDVEHAKQHFAKLVTSAKSQVHLVTGELDPTVFQDGAVVSAFAKVTSGKKPVDVIIVTGPNPDPDVVRDLIDSNERIKLVRKETRPRVHFMVVDSKHIRIEELHEPGTADRAAFVKYDTRFLGDKLEADFQQLLSVGTAAASSRE